mgnify:CR=1 FL=1
MSTAPLLVPQVVLGEGAPLIVSARLLSGTLAEEVAVQPLLAVTVTAYVPAGMPLRSSLVAPFDHVKVYGVVPPLTCKSMPPLFKPQLSGVTVWAVVGKVVTLETVKEAEAEQDPDSVTVTV